MRRLWPGLRGMSRRPRNTPFIEFSRPLVHNFTLSHVQRIKREKYRAKVERKKSSRRGFRSKSMWMSFSASSYCGAWPFPCCLPFSILPCNSGSLGSALLSSPALDFTSPTPIATAANKNGISPFGTICLCLLIFWP